MNRLILWKLKFPGNNEFNFEKRSLKKQQEFIKDFERILNQQRNSLLLFLKEN